MSLEPRFPDYATIQSDVQRARMERATYLGQLLHGAVSALALHLKKFATALRDGHARARSASSAQETLRRWAGTH